MNRAEKPRGHRTKAELAGRSERAAGGLPVRPQGLSRNVRNWWNKLSEELADRLTPNDGSALLSLCQARAAKDSGTADAILARFGPPRPALITPQPVPERKTESGKIEPPPAPAPDCASAAKLYAVDVLAGTIVAGKYVRLAAQRFLDDLKDGPARGIAFDATAAQHVVDYLARLSLGALLPWQYFILANLFGFKNADGLRRFRNGFVMVAKKNGKSSLLAGLGLFMADPNGDGEPRAAVYCAATTKYQSASICFKESLRLRNASPELSEQTQAFKTAITWPSACLEPLAANSDKLNGLNVSFGILDELSDHPTGELYNVFSSSTVGRQQPMLLAITTAGNSREQIAFYQRQYAAQVLDGVISADHYFAYIAELDPEDRWDEERNWIKANPSLGSLVPIAGLRHALADAQAVASRKQDFCRYHLNLWPATSSSGWIDINDLAKVGNRAIGEEELPLPATERIRNAEERLKGRSCVGGLDLAIVGDLSALCLLFPPLEEDGIFECLFKIWCPEENIVRRTREQRVPYQTWAEQGFISTTLGEVTDFRQVRQDILALRDSYHVSELGFDVHLAPDWIGDLKHEGMEITQIAQGYRLMPAIQRVEKLIKLRKFCMHGHPVAEWCFSNVALEHGKYGGICLNKVKSREKIDAATAAVISMDCFMSTPPRMKSVYATRGILFLDEKTGEATRADYSGPIRYTNPFDHTVARGEDEDA